MSSIDSAHDKLTRWFDGGCVGNLFFHRSHFSDDVGCFIEETVKLHEMGERDRKSILDTFGTMSFERAEVFTNKDRNLDRVKFTRRY